MDEKKRLYGLKIHHIDAFVLNKTVHAIMYYFSFTEIYKILLVFHQHFVKRFFVLYYRLVIFFSINDNDLVKSSQARRANPQGMKRTCGALQDEGCGLAQHADFLRSRQ